MKTTSLITIGSMVSSAFGGIIKFGDKSSGKLAPETTMLESQYTTKYPEAKRMKLRYGPFKLEGADHKGLMYMIEKETGVLTTIRPSMKKETGVLTTIRPSMKKPCTTCTLLGVQAGLEYADGTDASIDTGAWLHHMVMTSVGNKRVDLTCPIGLPGERFFSSGNERTVSGFNDPESKVNTGFHVKTGDTWGMEIELMNLNKNPITTYLTLTYDYVDGKQEGWKSTRAVWLDVTGCFAASEAKPKNDNKFSLKSVPWSSSVNGQILGIGGHVHDGGVNIEMYQNGKQFCDSVATYGGNPKYIQRANTRDGAMAHISRMTFCKDVGPINKGDKFAITANYDMKRYMPMKNAAGGLSTVMGIAVMYLVI